MRILGNVTNPQYVVICNSPEIEDLSDNPLTGYKGQILAQAIDTSVCAVAFLCPEVLVLDVVTGEGTRKPSVLEVEQHLPSLMSLLTSLNCSTLIPLGATLLKQFVAPDALINQAVGKKYEKVFDNKKFTIIPNFDPAMVYRQAEIMPEFCAIFNNINEIVKDIQWAILDYNDAIRELKRALKLFAAGTIDHIVFDTETTSLEPHEGHLTMYSWSHDADERGFAVPIVTNNVIPAKEAFSEYKLVEVKSGTLSNEDWDASDPLKVPKIDIHMTPAEVNNINMLVKKVMETIPLVGHNLKFDIKYTHYHGVSDLRKVHVQNDTYIMGFQVYGKGHSGWLSLKGMAQRYCGAPEWDAVIGDFIGRFRELKDRHYGNIPTGMLGYYACLDAYWNKALYKYMKRVLKSEMKAVTRLVTDMIRPFAEAEVKGVMVDMSVKAELEEAYTKLSDSTYKEIMALPKISAYRQLEFDKLYAKKLASLKKGKPNPEKIWKGVLKLKNPAKIKELMYGERWYNLPILEEYQTKGGKKKIPQPETGKDVRKKFIDEFLNDATIDSIRGDLPEEEINSLLEARQFLHLMNENSRMQKLLTTYLGENLMSQCEGTMLKPNFSLCGTLSGRMCVRGDTILSLLNGEKIRIDSLNQGETGWIMGCQADGTIVPVEFVAQGETKKVSKLVRVMLDNNKWIDATEDHPFMMRDGTYVEAGKLISGDSLMPFYTKKFNGYRQIMNNCTRKWVAEHTAVAEFIYPRQFQILKTIQKDQYPITHHIDFNKTNNTPNNLLPMLHREHIKYHADFIGKRWEDPEYSEKMHKILTQNNKNNWNNPEYVAKMKYAVNNHSEEARAKMGVVSTKCWEDPVYRENLSQQRKKMWENPEYRAKRLESLALNLDKYWEKPEYITKISEITKNYINTPESKLKYKIARAWSMIEAMGGTSIITNANDYNVTRKKVARSDFNFGSPAKIDQEFYDMIIFNNHKVKSIEILTFDSPIPVYDITCEGTSNFATEAGVFIHNSSGFHTTDSWSDIKRLYTSRWRGKGGVILAPDFSQLELRIAACVSGDQALIQTYVDNIDVHNVAASKMFKIPIEQVVKSQRAQGKTLNFSLLFGKTEHGLATDLNVSKELAKEMIDGFFSGFPRLKDHFDQANKWVTKEGCVYTVWGRRIPIPDWDSKIKGKISAACRSGANATIQSPASDCVLWTIRETYNAIVRAQLKSFMVASVHDSIEFDTYPGDFFKVLGTVKSKAEVELAANIDWIKCPITLGFEMGVQWGSAVEFEIKELTDCYFKGHGKGLRRDVQALVSELENAYIVKLTVLKEEDKTYKPADIAYVIRDDKEWEIEIEISAKNTTV